jgi:hypothetical protein
VLINLCSDLWQEFSNVRELAISYIIYTAGRYDHKHKKDAYIYIYIEKVSGSFSVHIGHVHADGPLFCCVFSDGWGPWMHAAIPNSLTHCKFLSPSLIYHKIIVFMVNCTYGRPAGRHTTHLIRGGTCIVREARIPVTKMTLFKHNLRDVLALY